MEQIQFMQVRRGEYVGAYSNHMIGRVLGDYSTGFWAIKLDGTRSLTTYATPDEAFEALALEFTFAHSAVAA